MKRIILLLAIVAMSVFLVAPAAPGTGLGHAWACGARYTARQTHRAILLESGVRLPPG
jgi:hypothetical protein